MQTPSLAAFSNEYKVTLEKQLEKLIKHLDAPSSLKESMLYSVKAGGKRIRPLLLFATLHAFGINPLKGLFPASAIEMIHTYSLIHDDLPSMDDDDLRRGKPTNHKVYGEAIAILAGDGLLTHSFQIIAEAPDSDLDASTKIELITLISKASGAEGMVGGQVADIEGEGKQLNLTELENIHVNKTGRLLACSVMSGAIIASANQEKKKSLELFAYHLGLAFQIRDDILDLEGNEEIIGKPVGSDEGNEKSTYPALLTLDGAKKEMAKHYDYAKSNLKLTGLNTVLLEQIADLVIFRDS